MSIFDDGLAVFFRASRMSSRALRRLLAEHALEPKPEAAVQSADDDEEAAMPVKAKKNAFQAVRSMPCAFRSLNPSSARPLAPENHNHLHIIFIERCHCIALCD